MSIELTFDDQLGILIAAVTDEVIPDEVAATLTEIVSSDKYPPDIDVMWDLRNLDFKSISSEMVYAIEEVREQFPERGEAYIAFVVPDDLAFGMSRMHEIVTNELPQTIRIFKDYHKAITWMQESKR